MASQRQGKIARLPHALRMEVNHRILNGELAPALLPWLNIQPDTIRICGEYFDGQLVTPQNLSEWRLGGFKDWLAEREKVENTKSLAAFAAEQAAAAGGGKLSSGLQAILAGHIMEGMEVLLNADQGDEKPDDPVARVQKLGTVIKAMRDADIAERRLGLDEEKVTVKKDDQKLAREKFETQTIEAIIKWGKTKEAQAILNSGANKSVQMAELRKLVFGSKKP